MSDDANTREVITVKATYQTHSLHEVELPEGKTASDIGDIVIRYDDGILHFTDDTTFEFAAPANKNIEFRYPARIATKGWRTEADIDELWSVLDKVRGAINCLYIEGGFKDEKLEEIMNFAAKALKSDEKVMPSWQVSTFFGVDKK